MANAPLPGYDTSFGNRKAWVGDHFGPASYATGGETFAAQDLGWGGFDAVLSCNFGRIQLFSISRNYTVAIVLPVTAKGAVRSVTIVWFNIFGPEVGAGTDLSGEAVRLFALGT